MAFQELCKSNDRTYFVDHVNHQAVPKFLPPRTHRAKVSVWTELSVNDVDILSTLISGDSIRLELGRIFKLESTEPKDAVLLDLYYYTLQFAHDNHFTKEQTSAFFAIVKKTHQVCVETPFGNLEQCFQYFKDMVLCHSVKKALQGTETITVERYLEVWYALSKNGDLSRAGLTLSLNFGRPPFSIDIFKAEEVHRMSEYVINTYFRHFKLYKYVFTPKITLDLSIVYLGESPAPDEASEEPGIVPSQSKDDLSESASQETECKLVEDRISPEVEAAMTELRRLVRGHLSDELTKLRVSVDQQLKASEDVINKKLEQAEAGSESVGKASKDAKGKKN